MAKELSFLEQLCYSTTRIVTKTIDNQYKLATGFFLTFPLEEGEDRSVPVLVTNKHVTKDAKQLTIWVSAKDENGDAIDKTKVEITIDDVATNTIMHPDSDVDLCIIPIARILEATEQTTKTNLFLRNFPLSIVMTDDKANTLDAVEDIMMVGYPNGLWDEKNNRPIFRYGITATDPKVDYNGKREFMIDCACIQGSSGSPVIVYHKGLSTDKFGKDAKIGGVDASLLGIQYSIPIRNTEGKMIKVVTPTSDEIKPVIGLPINLGFIVKSQCIFDFIPILESEFNLTIKKG